MANSTVRRSVNRARRRVQAKSKPLPLVTRRFAAWTVEVSLVGLSALIPYGLGAYAKSAPTVTQVTLNPVVAVTQEAIAHVLALPDDENNSTLVTPLTDMFWSVAVVAPLLLSGWQLYLLAKTGSTLPKRWFGVRVVTAAGTVPGLSRILLREGIGSWGLPLVVAYVTWRASTAFPQLGTLAALSCCMVLVEGISARFNRQRRCWHDQLAGTYVVDANRTFKPLTTLVNTNALQPVRQNTPFPRPQTWRTTSTAKNAPQQKNKWQHCWKWMRQHPSLTLLLISLSCMATVLGTLVGTQVYIQTQKNQRQLTQSNSEQFLALMQQLSVKSSTALDDRQRAILALGTINDPQVLQLLTDLLGQETKPEIVAAVQQALVSTGPKALPYLHRLNQLLSNEIADGRYSNPAKLKLRMQHLQATQQAIAKILTIYSGKLGSVDLDRINLSQTSTLATTFNLNLDRVDFSGIELTAANLNAASLQGSNWRSQGEDGHWDTFDDAIANLSDAQMKAANLAGANLSRVSMNRINLMRAILEQANLSHANLSDANLSSTQLIGANLQDAVLTNASLTGADLGEANLSQANLYAARLGRASALGTRLQSANLIESDWQGADLSGADLSGANLTHADLSMTRLGSTNLRQAQMQNINLQNADLRLADLRGANVAGADFKGAILFSARSAQSDRFIAAPPEYTQAALVQGVDFSKVKNLDSKQIAYICVRGGSHPRCP